MTTSDQLLLIEALKVIKNVCKQYDQCSLCPMGNKDNDCILESEPPTSYIITEEDIWRAVR